MIEGFWHIFFASSLVVGIATLGFIYVLPKLLGTNHFLFLGTFPDKCKECPAPRPTSPPATRSEFRRTPVGVLSTEELSVYNGENGRRILVSICGRIFDMTKGRSFYGPNAPYHAFAGSDATYLLGAMSTDPNYRNKRNFGRWDPSWVNEYTALHPGATVPYCEEKEFSKETLEGWLKSFVSKYPVVGKLRGFMDVCEESWNCLSIDATLAPGHVTDSNEPLVSLVESEQPSALLLKNVDPNKHIAIGGFVVDVSICSFVYGPITGDFPGALGHDISVAILKDDFTEQSLDQSVALCLDSTQQNELEQLIRKYRETYPTVGVLSDASKFQVLKEQESSITKPINTLPSSTEQTTEPTNKTENQTFSHTEPPKLEKNENEKEKENEGEVESEKENDNDWDIVQHSDLLSPSAEQRMNETKKKKKLQEEIK